jgi:hypothetical protein
MSIGHPSPNWRGVGGEVKKWKGFIFLKDETFLVTGSFRWDWMKKGNQFIIAPSAALPQIGEGCESSGVRELRLKKVASLFQD